MDAKRSNTRAVFTSSTMTAPVEKVEQALRVSDGPRVLAVVDMWDRTRGCGFAVSPDADAEVLFIFAAGFRWREELDTLEIGSTIECSIEASDRPTVNGREPRRVGRDAIITEPITTEVEGIVARCDDRGNAWLKCGERLAYFRVNRSGFTVKEGDRVCALVYDAPRGMRATRVEKIA